MGLDLLSHFCCVGAAPLGGKNTFHISIQRTNHKRFVIMSRLRRGHSSPNLPPNKRRCQNFFSRQVGRGIDYESSTSSSSGKRIVDRGQIISDKNGNNQKVGDDGREGGLANDVSDRNDGEDTTICTPEDDEDAEAEEEDAEAEGEEEEEEYVAYTGYDLNKDEILSLSQRFAPSQSQKDFDGTEDDLFSSGDGMSKSFPSSNQAGNSGRNKPSVTPSPAKGLANNDGQNARTSSGGRLPSDQSIDGVTKQLWKKRETKSLRQVSLDQFTKPLSDLPSRHRATHYSTYITRDIARFVALGLRELIFKRNETFLAKPIDGINQFYCTIEGFTTTTEKNIPCAKIIQHHDLTTTFIGDKLANKLKSSKEYEENCRRKPQHRDKVQWNQTIPHVVPEGDKIKFARLGKKVRNGPIDTILTYEIEYPEKPKSLKFKVAYTTNSPKHSWMVRTPPRKRPVVLDLFAGAGGMTLGLERAGFFSKYMVENDPSAAKTLRQNFTDSTVYEENVEDFLNHVEQEEKKAKRFGEENIVRKYPRLVGIDHVQACPPCEGFSTANRNGGKNAEYNRQRCKDFVQAIKLFQPRSGCFENVTGMLRNVHIPYAQEILAELLEIGYQSRLFIIDAANHGDPQHRHRVIIFTVPFICHLPQPPDEGSRPKITVGQAFDDILHIEPVEDGKVTLPDGTIAVGHYITGISKERDHLSQCIDGQCRTLLCQRGVKHPISTRDITILERKRLQSFPDEFEFFGSITSQRRQIGNAVPVNMATSLGIKLMETHTRNKRVHRYGCHVRR